MGTRGPDVGYKSTQVDTGRQDERPSRKSLGGPEGERESHVVILVLTFTGLCSRGILQKGLDSRLSTLTDGGFNVYEKPFRRGVYKTDFFA